MQFVNDSPDLTKDKTLARTCVLVIQCSWHYRVFWNFGNKISIEAQSGSGILLVIS